MNQLEFIQAVNGKPWVNRAVSMDGMDCYGLVILYYRHVLGIELPVPDGYIENESTPNCWINETESGRWEAIDRPESHGIVFTAYNGDTPLHVGIMIDRQKAIHCRGNDSAPGKVEIHSIKAIQSVYGKVTFHKYVGEQCPE